MPGTCCAKEAAQKAPKALPKLGADDLGYWQKQLRNNKVTEEELRKMFDPESVDEIICRLGRKTSMTHDKNKIIEQIGKSSARAAQAAKDFAEGRITKEAFEKAINQLDEISEAQLEFWKKGLID